MKHTLEQSIVMVDTVTRLMDIEDDEVTAAIIKQYGKGRNPETEILERDFYTVNSALKSLKISLEKLKEVC